MSQSTRASTACQSSGPDVGWVFVQVLKMVILLKHRRLVDAIVRRDAMIVRVLGQQANILQIVSTDVDIEEDDVSVHVLFAENIFQVLRPGTSALGRPGFRSQ